MGGGEKRRRLNMGEPQSGAAAAATEPLSTFLQLINNSRLINMLHLSLSLWLSVSSRYPSLHLAPLSLSPTGESIKEQVHYHINRSILTVRVASTKPPRGEQLEACIIILSLILFFCFVRQSEMPVE